jgi:glycosyltransferase involved in cell wall biosynthesis
MNIPTNPGLSRPLRVLQILEATTGGTRRHLAYLLQNLADSREFSLSLIYSPLRDPHFSRDLELYRRLGVTLYEVPMRRAIAPWRDLVAFVKIFWIIRRGHYDVVHAHSSKAGFLGRLAARWVGGAGILYTPHSFAFQYCPHSLRGTLYRWLERFAGRFHHRLVCVSEGERRAALDYRISPPDQIRVIPNVIDRNELRPTRTAREVKGQYGIEADETVIGMIAHFRPQKGYRHFMAAIPRILQDCPRARFLIVGDGPFFSDAQKCIQQLGVESAVIMAGYQPHPQDYYQIMDVFVLSSLWEGMPYVILEAMSMGLPVVATNIAGNNELVAQGVNGFLVPLMNSEQIASQVIRLTRDPDLRFRFGQASRRIFDEMPSIKEWGRQYAQLYAEVAGQLPKEQRLPAALSNCAASQQQNQSK